MRGLRLRILELEIMNLLVCDNSGAVLRTAPRRYRIGSRYDMLNNVRADSTTGLGQQRRDSLIWGRSQDWPPHHQLRRILRTNVLGPSTTYWLGNCGGSLPVIEVEWVHSRGACKSGSHDLYTGTTDLPANPFRLVISLGLTRCLDRQQSSPFFSPSTI